MKSSTLLNLVILIKLTIERKLIKILYITEVAIPLKQMGFFVYLSSFETRQCASTMRFNPPGLINPLGLMNIW